MPYYIASTIVVLYSTVHRCIVIQWYIKLITDAGIFCVSEGLTTLWMTNPKTARHMAPSSRFRHRYRFPYRATPGEPRYTPTTSPFTATDFALRFLKGFSLIFPGILLLAGTALFLPFDLSSWRRFLLRPVTQYFFSAISFIFIFSRTSLEFDGTSSRLRHIIIMICYVLSRQMKEKSTSEHTNETRSKFH